ncbi:MAG: hypothetical protein GY862_27535 [Gammaproteobacteria bacterium]|nr:hypothetical protein [Gammaproteobacteria bacterium]
MNSNIWAWPGLGTKRLHEYPPFSYERGIWGKVHDARSDFRWIARSPGFDDQDNTLVRRFSLGSENPLYNSSFWCKAGESYYAVTAYPSRASDHAGRSGLLEKQFIEWKSPFNDFPAVLGALLLLPAAATFTDEIWWKRYEGVDWNRPDSSLLIDSSYCTPIPYSEETLLCAINKGMDDLRIVGPEALKQLYLQVLIGQHPARLAGLEQALSPEALAVLLLPLERSMADLLSMAGWIYSRQMEPEKVGSHWDIAVFPQDVFPPLQEQSDFDKERCAALMAEALMFNTPQKLEGIATKNEQDSDTPASTSNAIPKYDTVLGKQCRMSAGYESLAIPPATSPEDSCALTLVEEEQKTLCNSSSKISRPVFHLKLTPDLTTLSSSPGKTNPPDYICKLYEFATAVNRRWLNPNQLPPDWQMSQEYGKVVCDWAAFLENSQPAYINDEQWCVKVDLLKAAAIVLNPHYLIQQRNYLKSGLVPPLFFAPLLKKDSERSFAVELEKDNQQRLVLRTFIKKTHETSYFFLQPGMREWQKKLEDWLDKLISSTGERK